MWHPSFDSPIDVFFDLDCVCIFHVLPFSTELELHLNFCLTRIVSHCVLLRSTAKFNFGIQMNPIETESFNVIFNLTRKEDQDFCSIPNENFVKHVKKLENAILMFNTWCICSTVRGKTIWKLDTSFGLSGKSSNVMCCTQPTKDKRVRQMQIIWWTVPSMWVCFHFVWLGILLVTKFRSTDAIQQKEPMFWVDKTSGCQSVENSCLQIVSRVVFLHPFHPFVCFQRPLLFVFWVDQLTFLPDCSMTASAHKKNHCSFRSARLVSECAMHNSFLLIEVIGYAPGNCQVRASCEM